MSEAQREISKCCRFLFDYLRIYFEKKNVREEKKLWEKSESVHKPKLITLSFLRFCEISGCLIRAG